MKVARKIPSNAPTERGVAITLLRLERRLPDYNIYDGNDGYKITAETTFTTLQLKR